MANRVSPVHQRDAAYATCKAKFSESDAVAVARANCFNEADKKYAPSTAYPDLTYLMMAKRSELAERQQAGKTTAAQANFEFQQTATQVVSEEQRRRNAAEALAAQQSAIAAQQQAQEQAQEQAQAAQQQANRNAAALMLLQTMRNQPAPTPAYQIPVPTTLNTNCQTYGNNTTCQTR